MHASSNQACKQSADEAADSTLEGMTMLNEDYSNFPITRRSALKVGVLGILTVCSTTSLFGCAAGGADSAGGAGSINANLADTPFLTFFVVSDTHITETDDDNGMRMRAMFSDMLSLDNRPSAIVVNGDITNGGGEDEYHALNTLIEESAGELSGSFVWVMGNHDQYAGEPEDDSELPSIYQAKYQLFREMFHLDSTYYDTYINDYHFIMLAPVNTTQGWCTFNIPDEELQWLDGLLQKDAKEGKPVFVFMHEPLDDTLEDTFEGSWSHGNCVANPTALRSCLEKYPFAVFFTGHTHAYPHYAMLDGNGPLYAHDGCAKGGRTKRYGGSPASSGLHVSVYADRVDVRTRLFSEGAWADDAQCSFEEKDWV